LEPHQATPNQVVVVHNRKKKVVVVHLKKKSRGPEFGREISVFFLQDKELYFK
jgi:hypothetical protein